MEKGNFNSIKVRLELNNLFRYCSSLSTVTSLATVPPTLEDDIFAGADVTDIKVPLGSVEAYKAAPYWSAYNIIGVDVTAIESPDAEYNTIEIIGNNIKISSIAGTNLSVYDVQGICIYRSAIQGTVTVPVTVPGVYVIKVADKTEKIFIGEAV